MANLEDGYIKVANELYEAILQYPFTLRQLKVVMAIMRKTYGFNKKEDDMSASQIGSLCNIPRNHVTKELNELVAMNVIHKDTGKFGSIVGLNKKYKAWGNSTESVLEETRVDNAIDSTESVPRTESVLGRNTYKSSTENVLFDSTESVHTKDNYTKDNQKTCANGFAQFWSAYPKKKSKGQAEKAFSKIKPNEQLMVEILASIEKAKTSDDWRKSNGQYIPYPATWLNARGWEDEDWSGADSGVANWWVEAGFKSMFDAENHGCTANNYKKFHEGELA